jgi:prepilin-type N-terminal cleavage/methylation domain-containing protein
MLNKTRFRGFSLVELVIVVVIIGVIAAIAVPRISRGAKGANDASVRGSLASLRNAIDMYAAEHAGAFPGADKDPDTFIRQLTTKTDIAGTDNADATKNIYGPYLRGGLPPLQVGPNKGASGVEIVDVAPTVDEAKTTAGWVFDVTSGTIIANTDDTDEGGVAYSAY